jgi:hypothetical protein
VKVFICPIAALFLIVGAGVLAIHASAQEHHAGHPVADLPIHEKFYSTLVHARRPDEKLL